MGTGEIQAPMLRPGCRAVPGAMCRLAPAGSTSGDLELGDLPTPAPIAATREAAACRVIDRVLRPAAAATARAVSHRVTGPARPIAPVVVTPQAARRPATARVPATVGAAGHTDRVLRIAVGVRTAVAAALLMLVVVAGVVPSTAEAEEEDPTLAAAGAANAAESPLRPI